MSKDIYKMKITEDEIEEFLKPELDNILSSIKNVLSRIDKEYDKGDITWENTKRIEKYLRYAIREEI